jgi:hypothetical protein
LTHDGARIKVLYLLARGRTGSTIVARVLGEIPGFLFVGEVRSLWDPVALSGGRCACGETLDTCSVWAPVLHLAEARDAAAWQREVVRERNLLRILRSDVRRIPGWEALRRYAALMGSIYTVLARAHDARVIVDSSKRPSYAALLRLVPDIEPFYVHVVRDPRASSYSWKHRRYESVTPGAEVTRRGSVDATIRWDVLNLEAELLARAVPRERFLRLRLEDFVASPTRSLERILHFVDEPAPSLPFRDESSVRVGTSHAIGGNPSSRPSGVVEIRDSSEWRSHQTRRDRWLSSVTALPLMWRYGYALRDQRSRRTPPPAGVTGRSQ